MDSIHVIHAAMFAATSLQVFLPVRIQERLQGSVQRAGDLKDSAIAMFGEWRQRAHSRRELSLLDDYQLRDIGLSPSQASFESGKSFLQG